jgi:hypothetical protein
MIQITTIFRRVTRWMVPIDNSSVDGGQGILVAVLV